MPGSLIISSHNSIIYQLNSFLCSYIYFTNLNVTDLYSQYFFWPSEVDHQQPCEVQHSNQDQQPTVHCGDIACGPWCCASPTSQWDLQADSAVCSRLRGGVSQRLHIFSWWMNDSQCHCFFFFLTHSISINHTLNSHSCYDQNNVCLIDLFISTQLLLLPSL